MGERLDPQKIRRVAIVVKPGLSEGYFERLVAALEKRGVEIAEVRHDDKPDGASEPELVFVLGGDGTMLRAIRMYPERVLLGVNLGKVGFMSGMLPDEIESGIEKVFSGGLEVQEYRMLDVRVDGGEPRLAANEAVLFKKRPHQVISVDVRVAGRSSSPSGATVSSRPRLSGLRPTRSLRVALSSRATQAATCSSP